MSSLPVTMDNCKIQLDLSCAEKYPAKQHAQRVAGKLGESEGLIYLLGQYSNRIEDSDQQKTWRQRRYFFYMSGVDVANCCLTYDIKHDRLSLYIPQIHPERVVWEGRGPTIREAEEKYDVDEVRLNESLFPDIQNWTIHNPTSTFYILHEDHKPETSLPPKIDDKRLQQAIDQCRIIKDTYEISNIRKANEITAAGHRAVLSHISTFKNESQIQGLFENTCISNFARKQAYPVIAGSGENAGVLHYTRNSDSLINKQLVCLDAGAEFQNYCSDVTRTFPISGIWPTNEAEAIYNLVQKMQENCIEQLKPGVKMIDLHLQVHRLAVSGLLELGILHNGSEDEIYQAGTSKAFYPHGLGHHVGLDVHDVLGLPIMRYSSPPYAADASGPAPYFAAEQPVVEEGMVLTIEPGVYFSRYELERAYLNHPVHSKYINQKVLERYWAVGGCRIEDDFLVTADGAENLTTAPKGEEALELIRKGTSCGNS